jgi:hypothetical protein
MGGITAVPLIPATRPRKSIPRLERKQGGYLIHLMTESLQAGRFTEAPVDSAAHREARDFTEDAALGFGSGSPDWPTRRASSALENGPAVLLGLYPTVMVLSILQYPPTVRRPLPC